ncbi:MAG: hypothetical protein ACREQA_18705 [Candidatus Binatia bacterium]
MWNIFQIRSLRLALLSSLVSMSLLTAPSIFAAEVHTSKPFKGVKANTGTVSHSKQGNKMVLTLSNDFKPPEAPDAHWQVIDSKGNVYMLQKLMLKGDKLLKSITLPSYIQDVAKVQMWCAFAETNLGEAPFDKPVK